MVRNNLKSYAIAIFALAKDKNQQQLFFDQINQIDQAILSNSDFNKVISSRTISKKQRQEVVYEILSELGFDRTIIHWVWAIIDDNNFHNFHYIFKEVDKLHQQIFHITKVTITSASQLSEAQLSKIKNALVNALHCDVELIVKIKPEVIGGLKIQINNKTYNNTFIRKLSDLKLSLLSRKGN